MTTADTKTLTLGLVGLGRMGAGLRDRAKQDGHRVTGYDRDPKVSDVGSLRELVESLAPPRIVWVMVPAGAPTEQTLEELSGLLQQGDMVVEGGNSYYKDSIRRAETFAPRGIDYVDAGVSGGIWGLKEGFCIMAGGPDEAIGRIGPLFDTLAPNGGWAHVGPVGSGHFVKMVHNGIEYGMLQAYAEGFELLHAYDTPLDLEQIAEMWNHGSVVRSWLLELAQTAFSRDPELSSIQGYVDDSGEGRWTVLDAVERAVPAGVIAQSLFARFTSRQDDSYAMRVIAALRNEFGGHAVKET